MYVTDAYIRFHPQGDHADWSTAETADRSTKATARFNSALTCEFLFCAAATTTTRATAEIHASVISCRSSIRSTGPRDWDYDAKNIVVTGGGATSHASCRRW